VSLDKATRHEKCSAEKIIISLEARAENMAQIFSCHAKHLLRFTNFTLRLENLPVKRNFHSVFDLTIRRAAVKHFAMLRALQLL
jgi:hypothetical protein